MLTKENASILGGVRDRPKLKPHFTRNVNKYEKNALLRQYLEFDEENVAKDCITSEESIEQNASILVNSTTAKNDNPAEILNLLSFP